jgi:hypothetical protein
MNMKIKRIFALPVAALLLLLMGAGPAFAQTTVTYKGQGFDFDGSTYNIIEERCGVGVENAADDGGTGQFANWYGTGQPYVAGDGYLLWVLTANGASSATLYLPDGAVSMIKVGGTFKYASGYYPYADLVGPPAVYATYAGTAKGNVQLVVSHGCQPFDTDGAWCSPGYWKNARQAAWTLIGVDKYDLFNDIVVPDFYANASTADPTLIQVLETPGANTFGSAAAPYGLNAFNATGAALTNLIPGYVFDPDLIGAENACPIDNHGNVKAP